MFCQRDGNKSFWSQRINVTRRRRKNWKSSAIFLILFSFDPFGKWSDLKKVQTDAIFFLSLLFFYVPSFRLDDGKRKSKKGADSFVMDLVMQRNGWRSIQFSPAAFNLQDSFWVWKKKKCVSLFFWSCKIYFLDLTRPTLKPKGEKNLNVDKKKKIQKKSNFPALFSCRVPFDRAVDGDVWHTFLYTAIPWSRRTPPPFLFSLFKKIKKKKLSHKFLAKLSGSIIVRVRPTTYETMRQEDKVGSIGLKKKTAAVDFFYFLPKMIRMNYGVIVWYSKKPPSPSITRLAGSTF